MKRTFDITASLLGLVCLAPILILIACVVALSDGLPILFTQERSGLNGSRFKIIKFRTMSNKISDDGKQFSAGDSLRVTRVGRILRKTKIDELPQLFNVLTGDMSVVGPRPEVPFWTDAFADRWKTVLTIRPGITDPASIVFRHEEELLAMSDDPEKAYAEEILPRKLDIYEQYIRENSIVGDLKIILRTAWELIK